MEDQIMQSDEEQEDNTPEWLEEAAVEYEQGVDQSRRVRFAATNGNRDVYIDEPTSLHAILLTNRLTFSMGTIFEIDGAPANYDTIVNPGTVIVAIGMVKGGRR